MKITGVKIHYVEWERGPYHWRDGIMPIGPTARDGLLNTRLILAAEESARTGVPIDLGEVG